MFPACICNFVLCFRHWRKDRWRWGIRSVHWRRARFFVTGPIDASNKLSEIYCRICRKDVSALTHGSSEIQRHFQCIRHFARDPRLQLETPGWRVFDFSGKLLIEDELELQREKFLRWENPFSCSGPRGPVPRRFDSGYVRKRSSSSPSAWRFRPLLMCSNWVGVMNESNVFEVVRLDGQSSKCHRCLVMKWGLVLCRNSSGTLGILFVTFLIIRLFYSIIKIGVVLPTLAHITEWVKAHKQFGFDLQELRSHTWVFLRMWRIKNFYRVDVAVIDRSYGDASSELVFLRQFICAIGSGASSV